MSSGVEEELAYCRFRIEYYMHPSRRHKRESLMFIDIYEEDIKTIIEEVKEHPVCWVTGEDNLCLVI